MMLNLCLTLNSGNVADLSTPVAPGSYIMTEDGNNLTTELVEKLITEL